MDRYTSEEVRRRWNDMADAYAERCSKYGDRNKEALLTHPLLSLLGEVRGMRILDAGCGEGFLSRLLAEGGASVVAIDYAERLLKLAESRTPSSLRIEYRHASFEKMDSLADASFDLVVSVAALQDIPDYRAAIREAHRVLRPDGRFVLVLMHPCFSSDGEWIRDNEGKKRCWKIDNYFYETPREGLVYLDVVKPTIYFHRTLTSYFEALFDTGFSVERLLEPRPSVAALEKFPDYADDLRMCHYLILALRK